MTHEKHNENFHLDRNNQTTFTWDPSVLEPKKDEGLLWNEYPFHSDVSISSQKTYREVNIEEAKAKSYGDDNKHKSDFLFLSVDSKQSYISFYFDQSHRSLGYEHRHSSLFYPQLDATHFHQMGKGEFYEDWDIHGVVGNKYEEVFKFGMHYNLQKHNMNEESFRKLLLVSAKNVVQVLSSFDYIRVVQHKHD